MKLQLSCCLALLALGVASANAQTPGSAPQNPITISTAGELNAIRMNLGTAAAPVYYKQTAHIALTGYPSWEPIGTSGAMAYIHYDGDHHAISDLNINRGSQDYVGLFGHLSGSVANLSLSGVNVSGRNYVGGLVGLLLNGSVSNCQVSVSVSGTDYVGGVVGWNQSSPLSRVSARQGLVIGSPAGGLVGYNAGGNISFSYAAVALMGASDVGGLVGKAGTGATVTDSYWDTQVSGETSSAGGGTGLTTAAMKQRSSFSGWDFSNTWQLYTDRSYPYLRAMADTVALPVLTPGSGAYPGSNVTVTATCTTDGATIHYAIGDAGRAPTPTDATTNTVSSGETIAISPYNQTLNAVAWVAYMNPSAVSAATYTPALPADKPTADQPEDEYPGTNLLVVLKTTTTNATIHYTTNGDDPDETSPSVAPGGAINVPIPSVLSARAFRSDLNPSEPLVVRYTNAAPVLTPVFSPDGGSHVGDHVDVTISCGTQGATIRYTVDGSEPTELSAGSTSNVVVMVDLPGTLKARAFHPELNPSATHTSVYSRAASVATPVFDPAGGTFAGSSVTVTVSCATDGAVIRYTTNGNDPTASDPGVVSGASVPVPVSGTLKAIAFKSGMNPSALQSAVYQSAGDVALPTFSPAAGDIAAGNVRVTITCATDGATIRYAMDGSDLTESSASGSSGMMVTVPVPGLIKARAWADGLNPSATNTATYTTAGVVAKPTFTPDGAIGNSGSVNVTLACVTPDALIHYTLDGSDPGETDPSVESDITVAVPLPSTLKAKAFKNGLFSSPIRMAYYGDFAGGSGTGQDPYRIATAAHLNHVRNHLSAHFVMIDDIDLGVSPWNVGEGWLPIDEVPNGFVGAFDGGGHVVRNLTISRATAEYVGLFGYVGSAGRIGNLGITSGTVSGRSYVGGLAGAVYGAVSNVFADCSVAASVLYAGGLAGSAGPGGSLINTYSSAPVSGDTGTGGLVGFANGSRITYSYAAGPVSSLSAARGGLIGQTFPGTYTSSFWDTQASGQSTSAGGGGVSGLTTSAMYDQGNFAGWDFGNVWRIDQGRDYPRLRVFDRASAPTPSAPTNWLVRFYGSVEAAPHTSIKGRPLYWEYVADTDPTDPDSQFEFASAVAEPYSIAFSLNSSTGRVYRLLSRGSLLTGDWQPVGGLAEQAGTGAMLEFSLPEPSAPTFYRIGVSLPE